MGCGRCWKPLQLFTGFKHKQPCTVSLRSSCGRQVVLGASHFPDVLWKSYLLSTQRVFEFHVLGPKSGLGQPNYLLGISRLQHIATSAEPAPDRPHSRHWYSYTWHCRERICKAGTCASTIPTVPGVGNAKNRKGPWGSKKGRGTHVCIALFREAVYQHRVPTLQSISSQNALMIPAHQSCNPTPSVYILQTQTTHACMWHMWHHMWFKRRLHQLQNHQHFVWQGNARSRLLRTAMRIRKGYGVDRTKENWLLLLAVCIFL